MPYFRQSVKVAGNEITLTDYEKAVAFDFTVSARTPARTDLSDEEREENQRRSAARARRELTDAINANFGWCPRKNRFGQWSLKFLSLTYKENMQDYSRLTQDFDRFIKRLKYHLGASFDYVAVPELQKRGAWHLHIVLYCPFIPIPTLLRIWHESNGQGSWKINKIDGVADVGAYVAKYMSKDFSPDSPMFRKKRFWASQGFTKQARVMRFPAPVALPILKTFQAAGGVAKVRPFEYDNEWTGKVKKTVITLFPSPRNQRLVADLLTVLSCEGKDDDPVYQGLRAKEREILALKPSGTLLSSVPSRVERELRWAAAGLKQGDARRAAPDVPPALGLTVAPSLRRDGAWGNYQLTGKTS